MLGLKFCGQCEFWSNSISSWYSTIFGCFFVVFQVLNYFDPAKTDKFIILAAFVKILGQETAR
jgi:hypothetical protein